LAYAGGALDAPSSIGIVYRVLCVWVDEGDLVGIDLGGTEDECERILADSEQMLSNIGNSDERGAGNLAEPQANP